MQGYYLLVIFLTASFSSFTFVLGVGDGVVPKKTISYTHLDIDKNLLKGSRWAIEQFREGKKIEVYHSVEIVDITKVDVDSMSIRVELHFRQRWTPDDLELPAGLFPRNNTKEFVQVDPKILPSIWSPDSYIPVARDTKIAQFTTQQAIVNIFFNKTIIYKARLYTVLGCMFDFRWYPLDKQVCSLIVESFTQDDRIVSYMWENPKMQQPIVFTDLKLFQYQLNKDNLKYKNGTQGRWGREQRYPYVQLDFEFSRQIGHNIMQVFIPTILVVILSWFSFWLGLDAVPGRISLLITCMLTLVTMHTGIKGGIPPVNYIKAMDIWIICCIFFVFMALFEFVIVKYLHWRKQRDTKLAEDRKKAMQEYMSRNKNGKDKGDPSGPDPYMHMYRQMNGMGYPPKDAWGMDPFQPPFPPHNHHPPNPFEGLGPPFGSRPVWVTIDRISRLLFPLMFLFFNAGFWPYLLIGAANQVPAAGY